MDKVIYLKYAELTLKKKNRFDFIKTISKNTKYALNDIEHKAKFNYDNAIISDFKDEDYSKIVNILKNIPGFQSLTKAQIINRDLDSLKNYILSQMDYIKTYKSFKIESRRQDKTFEINSMEINRFVATFILEQLNEDIKVDVKNPELLINIEVKNNCIIVYDLKINCMSGLPVGSSNRILVLLSGGIDSPVASKLLLNRGCELIFLTFITPPHTCNNSLDKIQKLSSIITDDFRLSKNSKLLICKYTNVMHEISHISNESYKITLMRRSFFRIASKLAKQYGCSAIATGEAIGQVASQTLESLTTISNATPETLVLRPLIGFDKNSIIDLAKKFNTYETSILNFPDSCSLFAPKNPVTKPNIETATKLEKELDLLFDLEQKAIEMIEVWNGK